ncbi:Non-specific serine/threonine protein kinase [Aphelenchoides fujianensis]|nr:Non-specific serine/threonine protein kinase [Aphelenchoides fujianensis]
MIRNSRMRRLASHLSVIRILLNPPSPPSSEPDSPDLPISPHRNRRRSEEPADGENSRAHSPPTFTLAACSGGDGGGKQAGLSANCFLQVPRCDPMPEDIPRLCSPPPRRCSNSSAYSEQSTTSSMTSYPNMLSPAMYANSTRSNSFASYSEDDNETPPNELLGAGLLRPHSTQSTPAGGNVSPTILLSPVLSRPVRSQSAHSPPFLRNSLVLAAGASDSDTELACCLGGSGAAESPTTASRATTICALNESAHSTGGLITPTAAAAHVGPRFCGSSTQSLQRHGSSASDSGSMYGFFYKRQSFRANRDSTNSGSSLNIPTAIAGGQVAGPSGIAAEHSHHHSPSMHPHNLAHSPAMSSVSPQPPAGSQNSLSLHRIAVHPRGSSLQRSQSEAHPEQQQLPERAMSLHSASRPFLLGDSRGRRSCGTRRPSACVPAMRGGEFHLPVYEYPSSNCSSHSNMNRVRNTLGHSDPQLYTFSVSPCGRRATGGGRAALHLSPASAIRFRKASVFLGGHGHNRGHRMSVLSAHGLESSSSEPTSGVHSAPSIAGALPKMPSMRRRRRPLVAVNSGGEAASAHGSGHHSAHAHHSHHSGAAHHHHAHGHSRHHAHGGLRSGSSLAAPYLLHHSAAAAADNRRWSLASLPSSSGYGTPGSISALSSEYSSQEQLVDVLGDLRFSNRYDSNDSYPSVEEAFLGGHRPRSRSLSSPVRFGADQFVDTSMNAMSQLYKERFPKAKQQMEHRLQQFLATNAPLSGFTSSVSFDRPASPLHFALGAAGSSAAVDDSTQSMPNRLPPRQLSATSASQVSSASVGPPPHSPTLGSGSSHHHRPSSPCRPTSPIPRPISPLATDSATAIEPGKVVFRSSYNQQQLGCTTPYGNSSNSIVGSFGYGHVSAHQQQQWNNESQSTTSYSNSRRSTMATGDLPPPNPALLRVLAEGATRFIHHQICEIAADCLQKSRDDQLTSGYFCEMSIRLEESLADARQKTSSESLKFLASISKQLLMIVARTARLLESLEFDPEGFYRLLEETEGAVRNQLGAGEARVPDLPQYIIDKLGLNKNLITDRSTPPPELAVTPSTVAPPSGFDTAGAAAAQVGAQGEDPEAELRALTANAPKEEDFETIRLISNGAYGAVYLVRQKKTRQRFALKKMKKTTLLLRNQVEQVFAERDILTFTDNPFVVCFYGSFETPQYLCMIGLMNRTILVSEGYLNETQQFKDNQLCGTPEYVSPEVILRQGYGKPVDWWALGIILYEFLIGIVPFMGNSPEELFTNIINEEVEYPEGEEALDPNAESLIQMLLEKNPVDRLGTIGGAADVAAHPFFDSLDFNSLLRQKAEFVPQLENEEDTSYFDSRTDRYNHDVESGDEEETNGGAAGAAGVPMFWSFSTASPRHSITAMDIPMAQLAALKAAASSPIPPPSHSIDEPSVQAASTKNETEAQEGPSSSTSTAPTVVASSSTPANQQPQIPSGTSSRDDPTSPSAILLRQRFSAQRQANYSTSSSGTTGTGCLNTCSSTDSSMDASYLLMTEGGVPARRQTTNFSPLPRFAISSCDQQPPPSTPPLNPQPRRATLSAEPEALSKSQSAQSSPNTAKRTESLRVYIPSSASSSASTATTAIQTSGGGEKLGSQTSIFYHATAPQPSPDAQSRSSLSSFEPNSPLPAAVPTSPVPPASSSAAQPNQGGGQQAVHPSPTAMGKPIVIRKGSKGFGFTIRSVRVYVSESSEYYSIEHIIAAVRANSPADEAGLRENDLLTHVQTQPVHNMTHPQLMHRLLSSGNEILLHVVPLHSTTIREGDARRQVGKLLRRKPRKPQQRRVPMEKKPRKTSALFRRLSGKRGTGEIVPGASSQKQSFMPRSASSQDGVAALSLSPAPMSQLLNDTHLQVAGSSGSPNVSMTKRMSEDRTAFDYSASAIDQPVAHSTASSSGSSAMPPPPARVLGHRRASGHQILMPTGEKLPGVDEEGAQDVRPSAAPRRKHTAGPTIEIESPGPADAPRAFQRASVGDLGAVRKEHRPSDATATSGGQRVLPTIVASGAKSPIPPPKPTASEAKSVPPPIPRPSTLLERRPSANQPPQLPPPPQQQQRKSSAGRLRPTELQPRAAVRSEQPTAQPDGSKHEQQVKRPPVPTRKLSPSRLVQRLFRSAAGSSSSSSQSNAPAGQSTSNSQSKS